MQDLAGRVYAGIGPPGTDHGAGGACEPAQRRLQLTLDGPLVRLELPTTEVRPVVVEGQKQAILRGFHGEKVDRRGWMSSELQGGHD